MSSEAKPTSFRLWTLKEVADVAGVSVRTLQRWIKAGKIEPSRKCQGVRIPNDEVLRLTGKTGQMS